MKKIKNILKIIIKILINETLLIFLEKIKNNNYDYPLLFCKTNIIESLMKQLKNTLIKKK